MGPLRSTWHRTCQHGLAWPLQHGPQQTATRERAVGGSRHPHYDTLLPSSTCCESPPQLAQPQALRETVQLSTKAVRRDIPEQPSATHKPQPVPACPTGPCSPPHPSKPVPARMLQLALVTVPRLPRRQGNGGDSA